jgi:hypothetical protein
MLKYSMLDTSCKNVLVRGVNWIGDGIMTLPALKALRKALPGTKISLLVKPWVSPVFEKNAIPIEGLSGKHALHGRCTKKTFAAQSCSRMHSMPPSLPFLQASKTVSGIREMEGVFF